MYLVICPEWRFKGFCEIINRTWFDNKATIIGLNYIKNNTTIVADSIKDDTLHIVFIDSIFEPLYQSIHDLINSPNVKQHSIVKIIVEPVPTHFSPSISIPITTSIDITDSVRNTHTLPRDSKMWNDTSRIRKTPLTKILNKLKSFPILTSLNSAKDFMYLSKVTKFPFIGIKSPWEGPVISHIVKQGAVGIACSRQEEHNYLRKFWNTYGLAVLEDITFQQPHPAHTLDFIEMLANKKYMTVSKRTNVDWKPDFDGDAQLWEDLFTSLKPSHYTTAPTTLITIHKRQGDTVRSNHIPVAKVINENKLVARLPLPQIPEESLPTISVCTLTRDHRALFPFVVNSLHHQSYPLDKIEWIILQNGDEPIDDIIPKTLSRKLKRLHIETIPSDHGMSLGELRNKLVSLANEPFVAFMDDDDLQFHTSLLARVKSLIKYNADCVGCCEIGSYDLLQGKGGIATDGSHVFSEASMMFRKNFWEERGFNNDEKKGEANGFLMGRHHRCISIPYHFVLLAMVHGVNTTGTLRLVDGKEMIPLKKLLTEHELSILESTASYLRQRYRVVRSNGKRT